MGVAIDQILRLAPSISCAIEPVVSSTKATSTVGRAAAGESGRVASANASEPSVMLDFMGLLQWFRPRNRGSLPITVGWRPKEGRTVAESRFRGGTAPPPSYPPTQSPARLKLMNPWRDPALL